MLKNSDFSYNWMELTKFFSRRNLLPTLDNNSFKRTYLVCCCNFYKSVVLVTQLCLTLCDPMDCVARQAPLSMESSRQEYWSGLPFPSPGDLPDPGIEPRSSALQADSLTV